jgi:hypothetical protein
MILSPLVAADWIKPHASGKDNNKWSVNPRVHVEQAARAVTEEQSKQKLARLMNGPRRKS